MPMHEQRSSSVLVNGGRVVDTTPDTGLAGPVELAHKVLHEAVLRVRLRRLRLGCDAGNLPAGMTWGDA